MVEIFKTNVRKVSQSEILIRQLLVHYPDSKINFDLEDCDCILRIAAQVVIPNTVIALLVAEGYQCEVLS